MNRDEHQNSEKLASEVADLEAWFASCATHYPEPACRVIEHVKMRTRVAAGEFNIPSVSPPSPQTLAGVKNAVRRELDVVPAERVVVFNPTVTGKRWPLVAPLATFATAAVIALVFVPGWLSAPSLNPPESVSMLDDLAYVLTAAADSEAESEFAAFEDEIDDLSDALASSLDEVDESNFDEIEDAIDQLLNDDPLQNDDAIELDT